MEAKCFYPKLNFWPFTRGGLDFYPRYNWLGVAHAVNSEETVFFFWIKGWLPPL